MQVRNIGFQKSLLNKVVRLSNRLELEAENDLKVSFGLTFSQFRLIESLSATNEITQRELAEYIGVTPAVVTKQAEALVARGLVLQEINPKSKREKILSLTAKGERAALDAAKLIRLTQNRVLQSVDLQTEVALSKAIDEVMKNC